VNVANVMWTVRALLHSELCHGTRRLGAFPPLRNSYLDSLATGTQTVDITTQTQGIKSFHPQRHVNMPRQHQTQVQVQGQNLQTQMPTSDGQQAIAPHSDGLSSTLNTISPNVAIPKPPELQPPPSPKNFDPHAPNFGTGTNGQQLQYQQTDQSFGQPQSLPPVQSIYGQSYINGQQEQQYQQAYQAFGQPQNLPQDNNSPAQPLPGQNSSGQSYINGHQQEQQYQPTYQAFEQPQNLPQDNNSPAQPLPGHNSNAQSYITGQQEQQYQQTYQAFGQPQNLPPDNNSPAHTLPGQNSNAQSYVNGQQEQQYQQTYQAFGQPQNLAPDNNSPAQPLPGQNSNAQSYVNGQQEQQYQQTYQAFGQPQNLAPDNNSPAQPLPVQNSNAQSYVNGQQEQPISQNLPIPQPPELKPPESRDKFDPHSPSWSGTANNNGGLHEAQLKPPQSTPKAPRFDPHEPQWNTNTNGHQPSNRNAWHDVQSRRPRRNFETVDPWNQQQGPQLSGPGGFPEPVYASAPMQRAPPPTFDPRQPDWNRPLSTDLQGTSWHNSASSWTATQGRPYQNLRRPPSLQNPMAAPHSEPRPFDPHTPDWSRPLSSEIQGESRNTWQNTLNVGRVMVDLYSDGRPIDTEIELWQGPANTVSWTTDRVSSHSKFRFHPTISATHSLTKLKCTVKTVGAVHSKP
jgi:hypothetical protein